MQGLRGIVAEIMTVFARKKMFAYKTVIYTFIATGILSFFVWAHHQFVAGIDPRMANVFTVTTVLKSPKCASLRCAAVVSVVADRADLAAAWMTAATTKFNCWD